MKMNRAKFWCVIIAIWIWETILGTVGVDSGFSFPGIRTLLLLLNVILYYGVTMLRLKDAGLSRAWVLVMIPIPIAVLVFGLLPTKKQQAY